MEEHKNDNYSHKYVVSWESFPEPQKTLKKQSNYPTKRWGHTMVDYRHYLYLYGGSLSTGNLANSQAVYCFNMRQWRSSGTWDKYLPHDEASAPEPRDGHSATVLRQSMYVFGGSMANGISNEFFQYDLRSKLCKPKMRVGHKIELEGDYIEARESHVAFKYQKKILVLQGGLIESGNQQDLIAVNIDTQTSRVLSSPPVQGSYPGQLESHCCVKVGEGYIIYGGTSTWIVTRELPKTGV